MSTKETPVFGCTAEQLSAVFEARGHEFIQSLNQTINGGIEGLATALNTSLNDGISGTKEDTKARQEEFGNNICNKESRNKTICKHLAITFLDFVTIMLLIIGVVSICLSFALPHSYGVPVEITGDCKWVHVPRWTAGFSILVAAAILILIKMTLPKVLWSKRKHEESDTSFDTCKVIRGGQENSISTSHLVVGDICILHTGNTLPVDGVLIEGNQLQIDESMLTGEAETVSKEVGEHIELLDGSMVTNGSGKMLVLVVGERTSRKAVFHLDGAEEDVTSCCGLNHPATLPLEGQVASIVKWIRVSAAILALLAAIVNILRFCIETFMIQDRDWAMYYIQPLLQYLIMSIPVLIASNSHTLKYACRTIVFVGLKRLLSDFGFVIRRLDILQSIMSVTDICISDDTSMLSTPQFKVKKVYIDGSLHHILPKYFDLSKAIGSTLLEGVSVICKGLEKESNHESLKRALLEFICCLDQQLRDVNEANIHRVNIGNEFISIVMSSKDGKKRIFCISEGHNLYDICSRIHGPDDKSQDISDSAVRSELDNAKDVMAEDGLRVYYMAYKDIDAIDEAAAKSEIDFTCFCVLGIEEEINHGNRIAIQKCLQAGICVRYLTNDNEMLARSCACKYGVIEKIEQRVVMSAEELKLLDEGERAHMERDLKVLACASAPDKNNFVSNVMQPSKVLVFIGSSACILPVLKRADIGITLDDQSTEVAKEVSDIVMPGKDLNHFIDLILACRNIHASFIRLLQFQLTVVIVAGLSTFLAATGIIADSPMNGMQITWACVLMTTILSLTLALEPPSEDLLVLRYTMREIPLFLGSTIINIIVQSVYQLTVLLILMYGVNPLWVKSPCDREIHTYMPHHLMTMTFNTFVLSTLFNGINKRKLMGQRNIFNGIQNNLPFLMTWMVLFCIQIVIVQVGGAAFRTYPLTVAEWLLCIFLSLFVLILEQITMSLPECYLPQKQSEKSQQCELEMEPLKRESYFV